jgi:hypothetical protein
MPPHCRGADFLSLRHTSDTVSSGAEGTSTMEHSGTAATKKKIFDRLVNNGTKKHLHTRHKAHFASTCEENMQIYSVCAPGPINHDLAKDFHKISKNAFIPFSLNRKKSRLRRTIPCSNQIPPC